MTKGKCTQKKRKEKKRKEKKRKEGKKKKRKEKNKKKERKKNASQSYFLLRYSVCHSYLTLFIYLPVSLSKSYQYPLYLSVGIDFLSTLSLICLLLL